MNKTRWRNYGLWISIIALLPMLVEALTAYDVFVVLPANYDVLAKAILGVLVLAGIINDPREGKYYLDETIDNE